MYAGSDPDTCRPTQRVRQLAYIITIIVNISMRSGTVPPSIKMALVTSSLRKPTLDPNTLKNYKPLSNLPYVSKILERIVFRRLLDYLNITHQPSSLGQSHASATTGAWPYRIEYYICLCGHLGGVSEVQTSSDVSDLFEMK